MLELFKGAAQIALIVALSYLALRGLPRRREFAHPLENHRFLILLLLAAAFVLVDVSEDVIGGDSKAIDRQILVGIHAHASPGFTAFCRGVTFTGSWKFLTAAGIASLFTFVILRRKWAAMF